MEKVEGINKVAVIGAGLMGFGIGVDFVRAGYPTWLYNTREESSRQAMDRARKALDLFVEAGLLGPEEGEAAYGLLHPTTRLEEAAEGADYVSESVSESLSLKRTIFAELDRRCPASAILTTNSSNFTITSIVSENNLRHPERCCVAHYFQPPHLIPLVEVVAGEWTRPETIEKTYRLLKSAQKRPVIIPKEVNGHAGNRIQGAMGREIRYLVDNGICTPEMVDEIIIYGFGRRLFNTGWFIRNDLIGLDFSYQAAKDAGREPWGPFKERVERGELGMKTGKGFYEWPDYGEAMQRRQDLDLMALLKRDLEEGRL